MTSQALDDVKILDLTHHISGPFCTKLLADYGAEVIKVERPLSGDTARRMGPFPKDQPHLEKSGIFLHLNTNKRGVTLNLKTPTGVKLLKELVRWADILVESFSPRVMPSLGLSYETLSEINPPLVMTSISNFGQTGPYRDFSSSEIVTYGMGGGMHNSGIPEREPLKYGDTVALYHAGLVAAGATAMSLLTAEDEGTGAHVDLSIMDTQAGSQDRRTTRIMASQFTGEVFGREPVGSLIASGVWPCGDGYIHLRAPALRFPQVLKMMDCQDLQEDPRFATVEQWSKVDNSIDFNYQYMLPWLMKRTRLQVWEAAQRAGVLSGPIFDSSDLLVDKHFGGRGVWEEIDHPAAGRLTYPGRPFIMYETPWAIRRPAPLLGQHNQEVFGDLLGYNKRDLVAFRQAGVI